MFIVKHRLKQTSIKVIEVISPAVQTDPGGKGLHDFGTHPDEFGNAVIKGLDHGKDEIAFGYTAHSSRASRDELDELFKHMNNQ